MRIHISRSLLDLKIEKESRLDGLCEADPERCLKIWNDGAY